MSFADLKFLKTINAATKIIFSHFKISILLFTYFYFTFHRLFTDTSEHIRFFTFQFFFFRSI